MKSSLVLPLVLLLCLLPMSLCLLKNCVTPSEWKKDHTTPKCEVVTVGDYTCLAKNQISVPRPEIREADPRDRIRILCWAPYPIDLDVDGTLLKSFPGIFFVRKYIGNSTDLNLADASKFEYTITVPLAFPQYSPRWWRIFKLSDRSVSTEFYLYSPGPSDKVLPYSWQNEKQIENVVVPETRFAVLPCTVTNPSDKVTLFKYGVKKTEIPVDNTTVSFVPNIGFILDTNVEPPPWGSYVCQATNPRTLNFEKFEVVLEESKAFVPVPSAEIVYSFSDRTLTLDCKSKTSISMSGTLNGAEIPKSEFRLTRNDTLLLKYVGVYEAEAGTLNSTDSLVVSCSGEGTRTLNLSEGGSSTHTWRVQVIEANSNEVLQVINDGSQVTCSSKAASVNLFNTECPNLTYCRSRRSAFERLGRNQCGLTIDIVRCGTICDERSPHCLQMTEASTFSRGYFKCEGSGKAYEFNYVNGYDNRTYTDLDDIPSEAVIEITAPNKALFVNTTNPFRCRASSFLSNGEFVWKARRPDGSLFSPKTKAVRPFHDYRKNIDSVWEAEIRFEESTTEIFCFVPRWNSEGWVNTSVPVQVKQPTKPVITNKGENKRVAIGQTGTLTCHSMGDPTPNLTWYRDGVPVGPPFQTYNIAEGKVLEFPVMKAELAGAYECRAKSIGGEDFGEYIVEAFDPPNITLYIGLGVTLLVLLIIILLVLYWKLRRAHEAIRYLSDEEVNHFKYGNPEAAKTAKEPHEMIINLPFNPDYEIAKDRLEFDQNNVLGSGAFGVVYRGKLANFANDVAIKTIKPYSEVSYFKSLLSELKVMIYLGKHENIVQLIGAYTANIKERVLYMVVELSPYGNLENYLRFHQKEFNNLIREDKICVRGSLVQDLYANLVRECRMSSASHSRSTGGTGTLQGLSTTELIDWAYQIANGMMHLESKKVIHADLATRNVLLYENGVVKITDFGLSRQLYAYTSYLKKEQEPLPWRWMALESLREMNFSTQSDVWGYGVTLWELFSLGAVPYPGLAWSVDFVEKLSDGLRLSKPFYSTSEIYEIMIHCWHTDPGQRPSFCELRNLFDGIKMRMMDPNPSK